MPDVPLQTHHNYSQLGEIPIVGHANNSLVELKAETTATQNMVSSFAGSMVQNEQKFDKLQDMMLNMAQMVTMGQKDPIDR